MLWRSRALPYSPATGFVEAARRLVLRRQEVANLGSPDSHICWVSRASRCHTTRCRSEKDVRCRRRRRREVATDERPAASVKCLSPVMSIRYSTYHRRSRDVSRFLTWASSVLPFSTLLRNLDIFYLGAFSFFYPMPAAFAGIIISVLFVEGRYFSDVLSCISSATTLV